MIIIWVRWLDASEHFRSNDEIVGVEDCGRTVWQDVGIDMGRDKRCLYLGVHYREDLSGPTKILSIPLGTILESRKLSTFPTRPKKKTS